MTEKISKILQDLIGLPLTRTTRSADLECLKFGTLYRKDKNGIEQNIGEFGLHIQSPWRLTNDKELIVGSFDLYEQADETAEYNENFNWDIIGGNLRDVKLQNFIADRISIVKSTNVDKFGGLKIGFDYNVILTVFPVISSKAGNEYWRLIDNRDAFPKHYRSTSLGYDLD